MRDKRLAHLGYRSYDAYLASTQWSEAKQRYGASERPQACICGSTSGLALHHLTYERLGEEQPRDLRLLCSICHAMVHAIEGSFGQKVDPDWLASRKPKLGSKVQPLRRDIALVLMAPLRERVDGLRSIAQSVGTKRVEQDISRAIQLLKPDSSGRPSAKSVEACSERLSRLAGRIVATQVAREVPEVRAVGPIDDRGFRTIHGAMGRPLLNEPRLTRD